MRAGAFQRNRLPLLNTATDMRGPLAQAIQDLGLGASEPTLKTIFDRTVPLLSSTPGQPFIFDDWADLREYGVWGHSDFCYLDTVIEEPFNGGWRARGSVFGSPPPPGLVVPTFGSDGYSGFVTAFVGDLTTALAAVDPGLFTLPLTPVNSIARGNDVNWFDPLDPLGYPPDRYQTRIRIAASFDCSSGLFDALNHRFRYRVRVPDLAVWEQTFNIPVVNNTPMMSAPIEIDISALGATSYRGDLIVTAAIKRNGTLIRVARPIDAGTTNPYDPPSPPVAIWLWPSVTGAEFYEQGNGPSAFAASVTPGQRLTGGAHVGNSLGSCAEYMNTRMFLYAATMDDDVSTYVPSEGAAPIASPAGHKENCTLTVRFLRPSRGLRKIPPFRSNNEPGNIYLGDAPTIILPDFKFV